MNYLWVQNRETPFLRRLLAGLRTICGQKDELFFDALKVTMRRTTGIIEQIEWDKITRIEVLTTAEGPFIEDFFFILHGSEKTGCVVPNGLTQGTSFLERLQAFPGFNNQAVIEASTDTSYALRVCWERP